MYKKRDYANQSYVIVLMQTNVMYKIRVNEIQVKKILTWCWVIAAISTRWKRRITIVFSTKKMTKATIIIKTVSLRYATKILTWATVQFLLSPLGRPLHSSPITSSKIIYKIIIWNSFFKRQRRIKPKLFEMICQ